MAIYFKGALVDTGRQSRIEALGETFGHDQFTWNLFELHIRLERLEYMYEAENADTRTSATYLQKLFQERDAVCPFMYVIEGVQALLYLLCILLILWVRCIGFWRSDRSSLEGRAIGSPSLVFADSHAAPFFVVAAESAAAVIAGNFEG